MLRDSENSLAVESVLSKRELFETPVILQHFSKVDSSFLTNAREGGVVDI